MSTKVAVGVYVRQMNTIELNSGLQASLSIDPGAVRVSVPNTIDDTGMLGYSFDVVEYRDSDSGESLNAESIASEFVPRIVERALQGFNQSLLFDSGHRALTSLHTHDVVLQLFTTLFRASDGLLVTPQFFVSCVQACDVGSRDLLCNGESMMGRADFEVPRFGRIFPGAACVPVNSCADMETVWTFAQKQRVCMECIVLSISVQISDVCARINVLDIIPASPLTDTLARKVYKCADLPPASQLSSSHADAVLREALEGNSETYYIATVSPCEWDLEDTLLRLQFASCAREIRTRCQRNYHPVGDEEVSGERIDQIARMLKSRSARAPEAQKRADPPPARKDRTEAVPGSSPEEIKEDTSASTAQEEEETRFPQIAQTSNNPQARVENAGTLTRLFGWIQDRLDEIQNRSARLLN